MTDSQKGGLSRRTFLAAGAAGATAIGLGLCYLKRTPPPKPGGPARRRRCRPQVYTGIGDLWRESWQWDSVVHSSHARANCISTCSWNVFVKNGIAWREEQNAIYEASEPGVPDFNPRGCQKGACYTNLMYEPTRVTHPLRRAGPRGSGRWKRVSWDEALTETADAIIDASVAAGTGAVVYDHGTTNIDFRPGHRRRDATLPQP